ncbi:hypothetical protein AB4079_06715 [Leifsonia sp. 2MCAF36]
MYRKARLSAAVAITSIICVVVGGSLTGIASVSQPSITDPLVALGIGVAL